MVDRKEVTFMPIINKVCMGLLLFSLIVPNFTYIPGGVQLLINSICVTALGAIFSVGLEAETTLDSKNKSDVSSRVCKRYDVGKDDENSENMETKDA